MSKKKMTEAEAKAVLAGKVAGATEQVVNPGTPPDGGQKPKQKCPLARERFHEKAMPVSVRIGNSVLAANPREFKGKSGEVDGTGSLGWFGSEKTTLEVDGVPCSVQVQTTITLIGSKITEEDEKK